MAADMGKLTIPVYARVASKEIKLGTLTLDVKVAGNGRVKIPSTTEIKRALRKGLR